MISLQGSTGQNGQVRSLIGHQHPFYVVAPPYTRVSAGIRALHLLCHCLNQRGQAAYILPDAAAGAAAYRSRTGLDMMTPLLTQEVAAAHHQQGRTPIVIYPETVSGNPYEAACVVRFLGHFPGFLGGDRAYGRDELCFGYSRSLAEAAGAPDNVLFIPVIDTNVYKPPAEGTRRVGSCFYADKYRKVHGGTPFALTADSVEIVRGEVGEQSPREIARLLQTSEVFYTYENTALALEAVLCGCPVVFVPNPWLTEIICDHELGRDGFAWGVEDLAKAKASVAQAARNYQAMVETFWPRLDGFIAKSLAHAELFPAHEPIRLGRTDASQFLATLVVAAAERVSLRDAKTVARLATWLGAKAISAALWDSYLRRLRSSREADCLEHQEVTQIAAGE